MRKSKRIILITIVLIYVFMNFAFAATGKVNIEASRVRSEPNINSTILTVVYENDEVEVIAESDGWYKIKYKEHTGYVKKSFIDVNGDDTVPTNTVANSVADNTADDVDNSNISVYDTEATQTSWVDTDVTLKETVDLKILPSFLSKNIGQFEQGKILTVKAELNNWIQVTDSIITGWILKTKTVDSASIPKASTGDIVENTNTTAENTASNNTANTNVSNTANNTTNTNISNTTNNTTNTNVSNTANTNTTNTSTTETSVNKTGYINVETANVRESASKSSKVIYKLDLNDTVTITAEQGDWYKITNDEVKEGYVSKILVTIK